MDLRRADLHTHTTASDGRLSPSELVERARRHGIQALAVTDHDTLDGYDEAVAAGSRWGVEIIAGIELSVTVGFAEVHLLGYFFDPEHAPLRAHLASFREDRLERARRIVARLREEGVALTLQAVEEQAGDGVIGRPHIALALVAGGFVASYNEAFDRYLRDGASAFVSKPLFAVEEALAMLHEAGGIGVLAHPGHWTSERLVQHMVRCGLDGLEVIHPSHDYSLTRYYREMARGFGLLETGGSDYHGLRAGDDDLLGRYSIPLQQLESLRRRAA